MSKQRLKSEAHPAALTSGQRARLNRILDAAEAAFVTQGMSGATMEGIAREACVAKATVYGYLPSKDAAFQAVAERLAERIEHAAVPWLTLPPDANLTHEKALSHITSALLAKQRIVFEVVRRSPCAEELLLAKKRVVAERFSEVDRRIIEGMALVLRSARDPIVHGSMSPPDTYDEQLRTAELCFRGAIGVANATESQAQMEVDISDFVQHFLS